jgi:hypothetical protein
VILTVWEVISSCVYSLWRDEWYKWEIREWNRQKEGEKKMSDESPLCIPLMLGKKKYIFYTGNINIIWKYPRHFLLIIYKYTRMMIINQTKYTITYSTDTFIVSKRTSWIHFHSITRNISITSTHMDFRWKLIHND